MNQIFIKFAELILKHGTLCWTRTNIALRVKETYDLSTQQGKTWYPRLDSNLQPADFESTRTTN